jgi:hypothetical protein
MTTARGKQRLRYVRSPELAETRRFNDDRFLRLLVNDSSIKRPGKVTVD